MYKGLYNIQLVRNFSSLEFIFKVFFITKNPGGVKMDSIFMKKAIELAKLGTGHVSPNPLVGAVIVKDGRIIGEGYHRRYGDLHAEREALKACSESPEGATIYVTLEPCCHHGKMPPCTDALIENNIKRVVIGSFDPNPLVSGKGIEILRRNGIDVETKCLKEECDELNPVFFHYITKKRPYVVMKYAMTMDGKIATFSGRSKWITGEKARENVHKDRSRYTGIMVGIGTVLTDNPRLNCRIEGGKDPVRIICDSNLSTPLNSNIVQTAMEQRTIIVTRCINDEYLRRYTDRGVELIVQSMDSLAGKNTNDMVRYSLIPSDYSRKINLDKLMDTLGEMGIDSILLEGGASLNWSALKENIVNKVQTYIAPKIFGGFNAKSPVAGVGVFSPEMATLLSKPKVRIIGEDILIESEVKRCLQE